MKTILIIPAVAIIVLLSISKTFAQGNLNVTVKNIKEAKGTIRIGLFNSEDTFLKDAIVGKIVKAIGTEVTISFENLKPGEYALSVIHDENENGELDSNMMGIPKEGFAFGNNAMGMFGPPSFEKAKLIVKNKKQVLQTISMKYL